MDVQGVNPMKTQKRFKRNQRNKGIKVVYISSPVKVKTSESEFRALVQELTGRDSDAERFVEAINGKSSDYLPHRDVGGDENLGRLMMMEKAVELGDSHESDHGFVLCDFPTSSLEEFWNS